MTDTEVAPPDELSFEALMLEIDRLTAQLERGDIPLEEALRAFERGMSLSKRAATMLDGAESRLVRLMEGDRGEVREVPLELTPSGPTPDDEASP